MFRCVLGVLLAFAAVLPASVAADAEVIWQIGERNHDFRDLGYFADLNDYLKTFPTDTNFVVGKSDPAKDFAWIQPGPFDAWADRREHPFKIEFDLDAPSGVYELQLNLVDTHGNAPPILRVAVNGHQSELSLKPGVGDPTLMHPEKGKAQAARFTCRADQLKQGTNKIEIVGQKGAWILYDSVAFVRHAEGAASPLEVQADPTIFFVENQGELKQEFKASISGVLTDQPVKIEVRAGGKVVDTASFGKSKLGVISCDLPIEPADAERELTIIASAGNQRGECAVAQPVQRKWRIYCAPSTHTDIGYTDIQDKVIDLHNRNTDLALELAAKYPLYHWNLESSWAAQEWLRTNPFYRHREFFEAVKARRIGIEAGYLNMLTGLCSEEELIRNLYYSARLHRMHGIPFESFTLTDAPSHVWSIPSILAGAGIRCISVGVNGIRAPLLPKGKLHDKCPFWWESPDGSRVLTWFTPGYSQAGRIGLRDGVDRMREAVASDIYRWDHREDYPFDAILLHGAYSDNVAIGEDIAESVTAYSERYAYPKVILSANNDFADYIEQNYGDRLPTYRGCGGSWWEDGAGSSAQETAVNRVVHQDIIAAEAVWATATTAANAKNVPQNEFNRVWDNVLLYDEHTWGAHNSMTEPTSDFVQRQWAIKAKYATDAEAKTKRLLDQGLTRLANRIKAPDGSLVIFNPSGRVRTGVVEAKIPGDTVIMDDNGPVPQQLVKAGALKDVTVAMLASDVPAIGYKTYRVATDAGSLTMPPARFKDNVLENDFYRVTLDPKTGGVASLFDKTLGKELVDQSSEYDLGQVIYALGGDFTGDKTWWGPDRKKIEINVSTGGEIRTDARGPVFSNAKAKANLKRFRNLELETILYEHERRVDFVVRLNKEMTYDREAVYITFPFAGANPKFRYEIGGGSVRPNEDHLPGACRDWFSVQRWVTVHTDDAAVAWSPVDTPLITLCDMTPGEWLDELPITNGTVFAYALNNYWFTNYKAGQDGWLTFRYSVTSDKQISTETASLFGESAAQPMRAVRLHTGRKRPNLPASKSFCQVEPETVSLTACKIADDGKGIIVRVRETAGADTPVRISTGFANLTKASTCDLVERVKEPIALNNGQVTLNLKANAMATIRLE